MDNLAAYGIAVLDGQSIPLTIENIAVALFRLFPAKFAMVGFPQYPDGMRANRTLLHMQPKYRNFATGSAKRGFSLTSTGRSVAEATKALLEQHVVSSLETAETQTETLAAGEPYGARARTVHDEDLVARVRDSMLYDQYLREGLESALGMDFLGMLGVFSPTPKNVVKRELSHLEGAAERQGDETVLAFLRECRKKFSTYLAGGRKEKT
ncbi:MAG: hypothetical protein GTO55_08120 [Armatimonadetes bacterium]|nr:hypothetical protein [Armatimonadota bacterium]NIM24218.1 hypothetical protein [Armatimonadota bacterium]NIM68087.1 hypothetical protein [Armatimonadota bacterium]NIM76549.1 hypothetical protein [Armatimonadota bacterium]NIN06292.1 hypothetical protein [Armatimonadota bacterium]